MPNRDRDSKKAPADAGAVRNVPDGPMGGPPNGRTPFYEANSSMVSPSLRVTMAFFHVRVRPAC